MLRSESSSEAAADDSGFIKGIGDEETLEQVSDVHAKELDCVAGLKRWRKKFWNAEGGCSKDCEV